MNFGKLNPYNDAKISFPGFQRILDFTATGAESTKSLVVDGDTDKEYIVIIRDTTTLANNVVVLRLNTDSGTNYGLQWIDNTAGTITAARGVGATYIVSGGQISHTVHRILTPSGFIKTAFSGWVQYDSGTTVYRTQLRGAVWNNTANVTSFDFATPGGGAFGTGTRIIVFARRTQ
jgi:hypothetical protein